LACNLGDLYEIYTAERAEPRYMCTSGHRWSDEVRFRRHRYDPPLLYSVWTRPLKASVVLLGATPSLLPADEIRAVHCGPPADQPVPPTPEEILHHAQGLGRVLLDGGP
jgi:hypothetical protein